MTTGDWDGVALIIGTRDIGKSIFDYFTAVLPNMNVIVCTRNLMNFNEIYLDLEKNHSFTAFVNKISLF